MLEMEEKVKDLDCFYEVKDIIEDLEYNVWWLEQ